MWKSGGCALLALAPVSAAEFELMGHLGDTAVTMVFQADVGDSLVQGRYFRRPSRFDVPLLGRRGADGSVVLCEDDWSPDAPCRGFRLRPLSDGRWQGEWRGDDGLKRAVELAPLAAVMLRDPESAALAFDEAERYRRARLDGLALRSDGLQTLQGRRLEWWLEPTTQIRFFRLIGGYPPATLARLNRRLAARHWRLVDQALDCRDERVRQQPAVTDIHAVQVTPHLLGNSALSVNVWTNTYCYNRHEVFTAPFTLAVADGRELKLEEVLSVPVVADAGENEYQRSNARGRWLMATMGRLYPKAMKEEVEYCDEIGSEDAWSSPGWYLTERGLHLLPSFSFALAKVCDSPAWTVLPWTVVARHRGPFAGKLP